MKTTVTILFLLTAFVNSDSAIATQRIERISVAGYNLTNKFFRTELYFGRDRSDGTVISENEWKNFLDREVTPRFPDGFTVLDGSGQYKDKTGTIIKEPSKVLIFLYAKKDRKAASAKIEEIRATYVKQFNQESVLRIDFRKSVEVDF